MSIIPTFNKLTLITLLRAMQKGLHIDLLHPADDNTLMVHVFNASRGIFADLTLVKSRGKGSAWHVQLIPALITSLFFLATIDLDTNSTNSAVLVTAGRI